jgi:branched-chain amino acid transport system substrate-binding protein
MGTFASNVGLAVADLAKQRKVLFLAAEPLTDKIVWESGNKYTFRLRASTYMQTGDAGAGGGEGGEEALGDRLSELRVRPVGDRGVQAADDCAAVRAASSSPEQAVPLGKIDAGAVVQALLDDKPDAIFSSLFGPDLARFVREGELRGLFKGRPVFNLLGGEPEYLDPLKEEAPVGWWVTGYPWYAIETPSTRSSAMPIVRSSTTTRVLARSSATARSRPLRPPSARRARPTPTSWSQRCRASRSSRRSAR